MTIKTKFSLQYWPMVIYCTIWTRFEIITRWSPRLNHHFISSRLELILKSKHKVVAFRERYPSLHTEHVLQNRTDWFRWQQEESNSLIITFFFTSSLCVYRENPKWQLVIFSFELMDLLWCLLFYWFTFSSVMNTENGSHILQSAIIQEANSYI